MPVLLYAAIGFYSWTAAYWVLQWFRLAAMRILCCIYEGAYIACAGTTDAQFLQKHGEVTASPQISNPGRRVWEIEMIESATDNWLSLAVHPCSWDPTFLLLRQWLVHWSLVTTLSADGSEGSLIHEGDAGATNTNLTISDTPWAGEFCFAYEGFTQLNHQASFSTIIIIILIHLLYHTTMARSRESVLPQSTMHFCVITMTHKWNSTSQHQPLHQNNYANLVCASALNLYLGLVVPL